MIRAALAWALLLLLAVPAAAEKKVVLLAIEGRGGAIVKDAVDEVLQRNATVISSAAFLRARNASKIRELSDGGYATIAMALGADAIVAGTWRKVRTTWVLKLFVREGATGAMVAEFELKLPSPNMDTAALDAIAAKLEPTLSGIAADKGGEGSAEAGGEGAATAPEPTPIVDSQLDVAALAGMSDEASGIGPISGRTLAYARAPIDGRPFQQVSASVRLLAKPRFTDRTSARLEFSLDSFEIAATEQRNLRYALREAYVSMKEGGWLLRVGQQIIPWGSSDGINPLDLLGARDYRLFNADDELTRIGGWSAQVSRATNNLEVTAVITPVHPVTTLLIPPSAIPAGVTVTGPAATDVALRNTEAGVKVKYAGAGWDVSVIGFRGFNHTPEVELVALDETGVVLQQITRRIDVAGLDGSYVLGKSILRFEGAYTSTGNKRAADPSRLPSSLFAVIGVERPLGESVRFQAQGVLRWFPRLKDPEDIMDEDPVREQVLQQVAAANALLQDFQDPVRPSLTARVAYGAEGEHLEAELFMAMNFVGSDILVRPLIGWAPTDAVKLQVGLDGYYGSRTRPLGSLYRFGGAFAQATFFY